MNAVTSLEDDLNHVLLRTGDVRAQLRDQRVFISGGTGFFGKWLLESFAWANDKLGLNASVVVLTRSASSFLRAMPHIGLQPAITFHTGDIRSFEFPEGQFRFIIHAAADGRAGTDNTQEPHDSQIEGMRRVLQFSQRCRAQALLFTSSGSVYGRQPSSVGRISADFTGAPEPGSRRFAYAEGKRKAEEMCCEHAEKFDLECKIARCFAFTGPYLPIHEYAIGNFIRDALQNLPIRIAGDGTPYRSYLYSADLVIWLWSILFCGANCRPYNVGSERGLTIADLARKVSRLLGHRQGIEKVEEPSPGAPAERYVPSTRRAQGELGLREWIDLDRSIILTARALSEQLAGSA